MTTTPTLATILDNAAANENARPLQQAYLDAVEAQKRAVAALHAADYGATEEATEAAEEAAEAADEAVSRAWDAWNESDEVRDYTVSDGNGEWQIASRPSTVCDDVKGTDLSGYGRERSTWWLHLTVRGPAVLDEVYAVTITVEPVEPPCGAGRRDHAWCSPHAIVGGLKENPGVRGHGGGVVITEVCGVCGCERLTDTWAQDPTDGKQGLTSVTYSPGEHAEAMRDLGREAVRSGAVEVESEIVLSDQHDLYVEGVLEVVRARNDVEDAVLDEHGIITVTFNR